MENKTTKSKKSKLLRWIVIITFVVLMVGISIVFLWFMQKLNDPQSMELAQQTLRQLGPLGVILLFLLQTIQIILAFLPGGVTQFIIGALYGLVGGIILCSISTIVGSMIIFYITRKFGPVVMNWFVGDADLSKYKFIQMLQNERRLNFFAAVLFLIPGVPKDALTYLFAMTPIKQSHFLIITVIARLPALIASLLVGSSIMTQDWNLIIIVVAIVIVLALCGLFVSWKILPQDKKPEKEEIQK